jgi:hypothetical protein
MIDRLQSYPRLLRLALIGFGLWGIHEVLASILWRNFTANLYPPEADSTSIPLMGNISRTSYSCRAISRLRCSLIPV